MRFDAIVAGTTTYKNKHGEPAPMEKIVAIAYTSHATAEFASREARHRLKFFAQVQNEKVGITGMLVYCEGMFVQTIEGPAAVVDSLYARIAKDARHYDVDLLARTQSDARVFGAWGMGYLEPEASPTAITPFSARFEAIKLLRMQSQHASISAAQYIHSFVNPDILDIK